LELFLKKGELLLQVGELGAKCGDFVFKARESLRVRRAARRFGGGGGILRCARRRGFTNVAGEKVDEAGFLGAGLAGENFDEWRLAPHEEIEGRVDGGKIVELVEALGTSAKLAGGLRAAEKQDAQESDFVAMEIEDVLKAVLKLGDAAVRCGGARQAMLV